MLSRVLLLSALVVSGSVVLYADSTLVGDQYEYTSAKMGKKQVVRAKRDYTVKKLKRDGNVTVKLGKKQKNVYLLFTNQGSEATTPSVSEISINEMKIKRIHKKVFKAKRNKIRKSRHLAKAHRPPEMEAFEKEITKLLHSKPAFEKRRALKSVALENSSSFSLQAENIPQEGDARIFSFIGTTSAHAKKVISNVETPMGSKSLVVWVSDNSFGEGCEKSRCVTQEMVDALAPRFLQDGNDNDIYEWVTAIYGEEWDNDASQHNTNVIPETNVIHILLTDIQEDNDPDHGYTGMFWSKDLLKKSTKSSSNEETMFYMDAVMFANGIDGEWSIDDPMPMEIVNTLIHEFQHMIHFYQKNLLLTDGVRTDSWINEMLSMATEDFVAVKADTKGPRAVSSDRGDAGDPGITWGYYPVFNQNNTNPVTSMKHGLASYSSVSAFGSYLTRNFGGAQLLHDIVHNSYTDERAIEEAVNKNRRWKKRDLTTGDLIREWGIAVLLSDHENIRNRTERYNIGDFFYNEYNGIDFLQGSINFYNYEPQPEVFTEMQPIQPDANFYYKIGDDLTGNVKFSISKESDMDVTLIIK